MAIIHLDPLRRKLDKEATELLAEFPEDKKNVEIATRGGFGFFYRSHRLHKDWQSTLHRCFYRAARRVFVAERSEYKRQMGI